MIAQTAPATHAELSAAADAALAIAGFEAAFALADPEDLACLTATDVVLIARCIEHDVQTGRLACFSI